MHQSFSSDESGEISWSSGAEDEHTFEAALSTPTGIQHRNKRTRNVCHLNFVNSSMGPGESSYNNAGSKELIMHRTTSTYNSVDQGGRILQTLPLSPVLKSTTKKSQISPILSQPKKTVKYLFTTILSPEPRIDSFIPSEEQTKCRNSSFDKSPVIEMKNKILHCSFRKNLNTTLSSTVQNIRNTCTEHRTNRSEFVAKTQLPATCKNMFLRKGEYEKDDDNIKKVQLSEMPCATKTHRMSPIHELKVKSKSSASTSKIIKDLSVVPLRRSETNIENVSKTHKECNANDHRDNTENCSTPKLSKKRQLSDLISPPDEAIAKKIKSYFDSHFSSENTPISIESSQSSEKSQKTQFNIIESNSPTPSQESVAKIHTEISASSKESSRNSFTIKSEEENIPKRKKKYRKDGLAGRLQSLVRKQRNQLLLWRHEVYLAQNSNFVAPNACQYKLFGIVTIQPEYGCCIIKAIDIKDQKECTIVLNTNYEYNVAISERSFLKVFEPYEVLGGNVLYDVSKFECISNEDDLKL